MKRKVNIVQKIESFYSRYITYKSQNAFNMHTDNLLDQIYAISECETILEKLKSDHAEIQDVVKKHFMEEYFSHMDYFTTKGNDFFVAYCLILCETARKRNHNIMDYYFMEPPFGWIGISEEERFYNFKTDVIRPIIDFIVENIHKDQAIFSCIEKYKSKIERFGFDKIEYTERAIQRHMGEYFFDNDLEFYKEIDTCNGFIDFYIKDKRHHYCNIIEGSTAPYVVEIKKYNSKRQIKNAFVQLKAYLSQIDGVGCLVIFTKTNILLDIKSSEFQNIVHYIIYCGNESPSKRPSPIIIPI